MRKLLVATHNFHKTAEFRAILAKHFNDISDLTALSDAKQPVEDGSTFAENSAIKALAASDLLPDAFVIADDSGLEVDALDGAPGIHSARYSGESATDASNRDRLMTELARPEHKGKDRSARFRCVITAARRGQVLAVFDGVVEGRIAENMTGEGGFGYDPLFIPENYEDSFGVLAEEVKNDISHRSRALKKFCDWLEDQP